MKKHFALTGALLLVVALTVTTLIGGTAVGESSTPDVPGSSTEQRSAEQTITVKGVTYTEAQLQAWIAAVERHRVEEMWRKIVALDKAYKAHVLWSNIAKLDAWYKEQERKRAAAQAAAGGVWIEGIQVCNGTSLPSCYIVKRESGFNPRAKNPRSTASGLYQFINSTWRTCGTGYPTAMSAPVRVQVECARRIWNNGRGAGHWAVR